MIIGQVVKQRASRRAISMGKVLATKVKYLSSVHTEHIHTGL